jgi:hypothetical protein
MLSRKAVSPDVVLVVQCADNVDSKLFPSTGPSPFTILKDGQAKEIIYRAFIEDELDAPKDLARVIHHEYFEPAFRHFAPRTKWSLQNAFTSGFKLLEPVPQFKTTASIGEIFNSLN